MSFVAAAPRFNFYTTGHYRGWVALPGEPARYPVIVSDEGDARFASQRVLVDWNGDGGADPGELLAAGEPVRHGDWTIRVEAVRPYGGGVVLGVERAPAR